MIRDASASPSAAFDYDVAVVGCGPVGALAANLLGQAGVSAVVLEQAAEPHPLPRAVHIDHEMMRLFQSVGLAHDLAPIMRATQGHMHIGADGGVIRYLGTAGRTPRFGWANDYFFYQPELEARLRQAIGRFACIDLRLGVRFEGLRQDEHGVTLTLAGASREPTQIRARYVIACDGASSAVRKALGVRLDDLDFEEPWLVVDAEVDGPIRFPDFPGAPPEADLRQLSIMLCDPRRPATIVPGRGRHRRWEFMLLPGEQDEAMMAPDTVAALLAPWVAGASHTVIRAATYRFHGLVAEQWRVGRVFLAGDAAHQTPPFFGQGMCHGMRDVANLAWKLGLVLNGVADPALLDTYQPERDPHVRGVIGAAVHAGRYICELDPQAAAKRDLDLRQAMQDAVPGATAADLIPAYDAGVVAQTAGAGERFIHPRVIDPSGQSVLLDDVTGGGFALLTRSAALSIDAAHEAFWRRIGGTRWRLGDGPGQLRAADGALDAWFDAKGCEAVLLRPDFYVYGVATTPEDLETLLAGLRADLRASSHPARRGAGEPVAQER